MTRRRTIVLCLIACAVVAAIAFRPARHHAPAAQARIAASPPPELVARVKREVAERNKAARHEEEVFRAAGWKIVQGEEPPDPRLTEYDPSLLAEGRERELRYQLLTTSPGKRHAHRIAQIVLLAHDPATREAAALALGRIRSPEAQDEIMGLLTGGKLEPEDLGRRQLAALLRPEDLDDPIAAKMASLLDSPALTSVEKQQVAFTLGLVSLRDGMQLPDAVNASISPESRALIAQMTARGERSYLFHSHAAHPHHAEE